MFSKFSPAKICHPSKGLSSHCSQCGMEIVTMSMNAIAISVSNAELLGLKARELFLVKVDIHGKSICEEFRHQNIH